MSYAKEQRERAFIKKHTSVVCLGAKNGAYGSRVWVLSCNYCGTVIWNVPLHMVTLHPEILETTERKHE